MKKKADIVCLNCGKLFHARRKESKFCCRACGIEYNKIHGKYIKTEEQKKKLSETKKGSTPWNKGRKCTEEELIRMSETSKKVWSRDGYKEKMSDIQKKAWSNEELLEKHSELQKETHGSEIYRQKVSKQMKEYSASLTEEEKTARYMKSVNTKKEKGTLYESASEKTLKEYIDSLGFNNEKYVEGKDNNRFEIDIYIPKKKIGIEYNGTYYHSINGGNKRKIAYHFNKNVYAEKQGIELIQIWEDQWKNKRDLIKDIIAIRLGISTEKSIYARKCELKEINTSTYRKFCESNHIQGYRSASVKLGLYYDELLVQVASFNKARSYGNNSLSQYEWEWIRGCCLRGYSIVGGTSKLFKYFVDKYNPSSVLCYCDWNLFSGKGYEKCGFKLEGYTGPDLFFVVNSSSMARINRNPYSNKQHKEMVKQGKLFECHGCGSKKYVWYKEN